MRESEEGKGKNPADGDVESGRGAREEGDWRVSGGGGKTSRNSK